MDYDSDEEGDISESETNENTQQSLPITYEPNQPQLQKSCWVSLGIEITKAWHQILCPRYFILFNLICLCQTVPALYYYISFFKKGFFMSNSSGMATVWGATVGAICSVIVTTALGPLPPNLISRPFCIAVICWEFIIFLSLLIAAITLGYMRDFHGVIWASVGSFSGLVSGVFLRWLGVNIDLIKIRSKVASEGDYLYGLSNEVNFELVIPPADAIFDDGGFETGSKVSAHVIDTNEDETKPSQSFCSVVIFYAVQSLLWLVLFVFCVIPAGFGVNQAMAANEYHMYPAPGSLIQVPHSLNSTIDIPLHLWCRGPSTLGRPFLVIEADFGQSGFLYVNLQDKLTELGWRVCVYDRPGYGWSNMAPLGAANPTTTVMWLRTALKRSGELLPGAKIILVGHGTGSELMQIYTYQYPSEVAGLALVDGYSSMHRLLGDSPKAVAMATAQACGSLQIGRALESVAIMRAVTDYNISASQSTGTGFTPSNHLAQYQSTLTNGRYYATLYSDRCINANAAVANTDYLTAVGTPTHLAQRSISSTLGISVLWPQVPAGVPVLIVSASETIAGNAPNAALLKFQAQLYNATISPTNSSAWIICKGCPRSFPFDSNAHASWLANALNNRFDRILS